MSDQPLVCSGCGETLPHGAMFCGECGRAVAPSVLSPARAAEHCDRCGTELLPGDIFCGECGHVAGSISRAYAAGRDTAVIEPVSAPERPAGDERPVVVDRIQSTDRRPGLGDVRSSLSERMRRPQEPRFIEPLHSVAGGARSHPQHAAEPEDAARPATGSVRAGSERDESDRIRSERDESDHADVEATRIVPPRGRGDRFVLQFSTGESVTVYGSGLVGRNPVPEPGEYFDQLVRVFDPARSVSKTHLEFGQDSGSFWVRDRYSGNGTILREPDSRPVRCDPGKRYSIMRGGRIDLGEQFLVVS